MALFLSTYVNKIDRKGRVSVPAQFRKVLQKQSPDFDGLVLFPAPDGRPCLIGTGLDWLETISGRMSPEEALISDSSDYALSIMGSAMPIEFQDNGRISIPESLLAPLGIDGEIAFVGAGQTFQLWHPHAAEQAKSTARANVAARQGAKRSEAGGAG